MILELAPDYDLFLKVLFWMWVIRGMSYLINGLFRIEIPKRESYGWEEACTGILMLSLATIISL